MVNNNYVLSSVQKAIDSIVPSQVEMSIKFAIKFQEIYNKGCLYKKNENVDAVHTYFDILFEIPKHLNFEQDVLNLFFPIVFLEETPSDKVKLPIFIGASYKLGEKGIKRGGDEEVESMFPITTDLRRHILALNIKGLQRFKKYNYGRVVIKIAMSETYSNAYITEGNIYNALQEKTKDDNIKENIVKMIKTGKLSMSESVHIKDNGDMILSIGKLLGDKSIPENVLVTLPKANEYIGMTFLLLEHCYNHTSIGDYVRTNPGSVAYSAFRKTMKLIKHLNCFYGFFHGDFHKDNALIDEHGGDIKLLDFDFSALISKEDRKQHIISNSLLMYNLIWTNSCESQDPSCKIFQQNVDGTKTILQSELNKFEVYDFFFTFDYFRLLFSIMRIVKITQDDLTVENVLDGENFKIVESEPCFEERSKNIRNWFVVQFGVDETGNVKTTGNDNWHIFFQGKQFHQIYKQILCSSRRDLTPAPIATKVEFTLDLFQNLKLGSDDLSSNFSDSLSLDHEGNSNITKGGSKMKKYVRYGTANVHKDNKTTKRVIYKLGKAFYLRDSKGVYSVIKKKAITFLN